MGALLWQLDTAILRPHQRIVDWAAETICLDKRSWARLYGTCGALILYTLSLAANYYFGIAIKTDGGLHLIVLPIALLPMVAALTSCAPRSNARFHLVGFRIIAIATFSLVALVNFEKLFSEYVLLAVNGLGFITIFVNVIYFLSCESPPPKKRPAMLFKELKERLSGLLAPAQTPAPARIPAPTTPSARAPPTKPA